jgi:hypothetical protein
VYFHNKKQEVIIYVSGIDMESLIQVDGDLFEDKNAVWKIDINTGNLEKIREKNN